MKVLAALVGVIAIFAIRATLQDTYNTVATAVVAGNQAASCVAMLGNTMREDENGANYVVGSVRNDCDRRIGMVTVLFKIEGASSDSFGRGASAYAYVNGLKPHETREFKSAVPIGKNEFVHFDKINAF